MLIMKKYSLIVCKSGRQLSRASRMWHPYQYSCVLPSNKALQPPLPSFLSPSFPSFLPPVFPSFFSSCKTHLSFQNKPVYPVFKLVGFRQKSEILKDPFCKLYVTPLSREKLKVMMWSFLHPQSHAGHVEQLRGFWSPQNSNLEGPAQGWGLQPGQVLAHEDKTSGQGRAKDLGWRVTRLSHSRTWPSSLITQCALSSTLVPALLWVHSTGILFYYWHWAPRAETSTKEGKRNSEVQWTKSQTGGGQLKADAITAGHKAGDAERRSPPISLNFPLPAGQKCNPQGRGGRNGNFWHTQKGWIMGGGAQINSWGANLPVCRWGALWTPSWDRAGAACCSRAGSWREMLASVLWGEGTGYMVRSFCREDGSILEPGTWSSRCKPRQKAVAFSTESVGCKAAPQGAGNKKWESADSHRQTGPVPCCT